MKRASVAVTVIMTLAISAVAQRAQNNTDEKLKARNAPGVFIYSASSFGPDKNGDSNFSIDVGNTGTKTITAIEWEYYRSDDGSVYAATTSERFRHDKLKLLPDQQTKFSERVHRYSDDFVKGFNLDSVRIVAVQFDDGSSWKRQDDRSEEHTSELQSLAYLVCRLLL